MRSLEVKIVQGDIGPKYLEPNSEEITIEGVTIVERGTQSNLPFVDFRMRDTNGEFRLLVLTGREVQALASAIAGINYRNHGNTNP